MSTTTKILGRIALLLLCLFNGGQAKAYWYVPATLDYDDVDSEVAISGVAVSGRSYWWEDLWGYCVEDDGNGGCNAYGWSTSAVTAGSALIDPNETTRSTDFIRSYYLPSVSSIPRIDPDVDGVWSHVGTHNYELGFCITYSWFTFCDDPSAYPMAVTVAQKLVERLPACVVEREEWEAPPLSSVLAVHFSAKQFEDHIRKRHASDAIYQQDPPNGRFFSPILNMSTTPLVFANEMCLTLQGNFALFARINPVTGNTVIDYQSGSIPIGLNRNNVPDVDFTVVLKPEGSGIYMLWSAFPGSYLLGDE
jgi:hypothetical protein